METQAINSLPPREPQDSWLYRNFYSVIIILLAIIISEIALWQINKAVEDITLGKRPFYCSFISDPLTCSIPSVNETENQPNQNNSALQFIEREDVSNWQTYRNDTYGFEASYPLGWTAGDSDSYEYGKFGKTILSTFFTEPDESNKMWPGSFEVSIYAAQSNTDLSAWIVSNSLKAPLGGQLVREISEVEFLGFLAKEASSFNFDSSSRLIIFQKGSLIFTLVFDKDNGNDPEFQYHQEIYEKILSTFKFFENETVNWQTYRNEQYGFEFKYPAHIKTSEDVPAKDKDINLECFEPADLKGGSFCVRLFNQELVKDKIESIYGTIENSRISETKIAGRTAYYFSEGDAGCGGRDYRVYLDKQSHLSTWFVDCELNEPYIEQYIDQILSTFKFID